MDRYQRVYASDAERYDDLVAAEDADGHLARALGGLVAGARRVVDVGCGTGRVTRLIEAASSAEVWGVEPAPAMLEVARRRSPAARFDLGGADALPVPDAWADVAVAGWVFGHQTSWAGERWPEVIGKFLDEMRRVVRTGGTLAVIETLGTARGPVPTPPSPAAEAYYRWLEEVHGFTRLAIDTSYRFRSVDHAVESVTFFFGAELGDRVRRFGSERVPEWTGLWVAERAT